MVKINQTESIDDRFSTNGLPEELVDRFDRACEYLGARDGRDRARQMLRQHPELDRILGYAYLLYGSDSEYNGFWSVDEQGEFSRAPFREWDMDPELVDRFNLIVQRIEDGETALVPLVIELLKQNPALDFFHGDLFLGVVDQQPANYQGHWKYVEGNLVRRETRAWDIEKGQ